jgi:DtxR family Mn-dependent transcriptional regulator
MASLSVTTEDYLKCVSELTEYKGFASLTDISNILGTVRQTVYDEINILIDRSYIIRTERGKYILSEEGKVQANNFMRKHRVAEILLWKSLGIKWSMLDDEAMGIEHGMTENIITKVCERYGCTVCPHGNPIPDKYGVTAILNDVDGSVLNNNEHLKVSRVIFESPEVLRFMEDNSMLPGEVILIENVENRMVFVKGSKIQIPDEIFRAIRFFKIDKI